MSRKLNRRLSTTTRAAIAFVAVVVVATGGAQAVGGGGLSLPRAAASAADSPQQPIVAAYWQGTPAASGIPSAVNMILYAFASPSGGTCNTPSSTTKSRINSLSTLKTQNPSLKVLISIGGWGAAGFGADSATDTSRKAFVASCISRWMSVFPAGLVNGFDLDWEFPVYGGLPSIGSSPNDRANLDLLVQEFRTELNAYAAANNLSTSSMLITMPIPAGREQDAGDGIHGGPFDQNTSFDLAALGQLLDYVNLETYDLCTGYSTVSCFNDPMVQEPGDPNDQYNNTVGAIQYMEDHGVPAQKMLLGFPFYGRYFNVTSSANGGLYQPWTSSTTVNYSQIAGSQYLANPGYLMGWDPVVDSPYLWNPTTKTWVSYENPQSLGLKSQYAKTAGLSGVFMWQLGGDDSQHSLLRAMARPWVPIAPAAGAAPVVNGVDFSAFSTAVPVQFSGTVATVTDPDTPASGETATINWGDNTVSTGIVAGADGEYTVTGSHSYAAAGVYTLTVTVGDGDPINLISANSTAAVALDTTPPVTTASLSPAAVNGWYPANPLVTLTASDGAGSGVASTEYALDGGGWQPYSGPFGVTGDGSHTLAYRSTDNAGNVETAGSLSFEVDTAAPVTSASLAATPVGAWFSARTVTLSATDGALGSGVVSTMYSLDGGAWTSYSGPFAVTSFGPHALSFYSVDLAGNREATESVSWGSSFTASQQLAGLGGFLAGLGLDKGLANGLQNNLDDAQKKLAKTPPPPPPPPPHGKPPPPPPPPAACGPLNAFVSSAFANVGGPNPKLTVAQALSLLSVNQIEATIGCIGWDSAAPAAEGDLLGLVSTIDGMGLDNGFSNGLESDVSNIGGNVAGGKDACKPLENLTTKISTNVGKKNGPTAAQAATLNAAITDISSELGC